MKIIGTERMSAQALNEAVADGGRFVVYQYCVSVLVMSFRRSSSVHFVPRGASAARKGARFTALSLLAGWWGIPWGPVWTVSTVCSNCKGGVDVTSGVMQALEQR